MNDASKLLGEDGAIVMDEYLRDTYLQTANVIWAGTAQADNQITLQDVFSTDMIRDGVEILKTLNVRPISRPGDSPAYICFAHPHQIRHIKEDPYWQDASKYANPRNIYYGEVGRYDNVIFIETTQMPVDENAGFGGAVDVYSALMFGDRAVGLGISKDMEMTSNGVIDHKRWLSLGWHSIHGAGLMNDFCVGLHTA
jgi:N4-gp56 family major capsid protein